MSDSPDLSTLIIRIDDIRKAGYCTAGARAWFRRHDIPFADFLQKGIAADELLARGDDLARVVIERKIEREARNG